MCKVVAIKLYSRSLFWIISSEIDGDTVKATLTR